jgi:hypothetical protein
MGSERWESESKERNWRVVDELLEATGTRRLPAGRRFRELKNAAAGESMG